ncbi:MAG: GTPase [Lactococcus lactis]|uniref:GTPase n=1 Tax=Enterococcus TaxID=1350 RepID=UPI001160AB10|nr:GTPase [Enterococcus durans]MDN6011613.1 GTPase [Lactococcus lactis]
MKLSKEEHAIIHTATVAAGTVSASPIPFSDAAMLVPIQTTMITGLYKANGKNISQGIVQGMVKATIISGFGKSAAGNLIKFVPGVGTVVGGALNATVAIAFTEALGFAVSNELKGTEDADMIDLMQVITDVLKGFKKKK